MGSVTNRQGILQFDFRYRGQRCRESTGMPDTPSNRKRCEKAMARIEAEMLLGTFDYASYFPNSGRLELLTKLARREEILRADQPLFRDFADIWYGEKRVEWRRSYADTMRGSLDKYLIPTFGDVAVNLIDKAEIMAFRSSLADVAGRSDGSKLSAARINKIMMPLRMILIEAADRYDFTSPWRNIKPVKQKKPNVDPFTIEEVQRFLDRVRPDMRNYYATRFFTGMRSSEVDGLQWQYIDFDRRQILIRQALVQGRLEDTKTDGSTREIEMNHLVYDALQAQAKVTRGFSDFVFCMRTGNPLINRNVTGRIWYPTLRHLGLRERRPYQTRHTTATLWLASGENPEWIARQMGHTTTEMLFRVYSRFVPNLTRKDGSAFENLLLAKLGGQQ
jgi:integrase